MVKAAVYSLPEGQCAIHNVAMYVDREPRSPSAAGRRILVCDDSPVERMALAHFLRRAGYRVDEVEDGASALEHLKNREVDLVMLDLEMPGLDGFDVLRHLQNNRRGLPVILLTGMTVEKIQPQISALPAHALPPMFLKPVDPNSLLDVVEMQLSGELDDVADFNNGDDESDSLA